MRGRGQVDQIKLTLMIPDILVRRIEARIKKDGSATSVADFMRQAAARDLDRNGHATGFVPTSLARLRKR
jgi:hypothetical protein